MGEIVNLRMKRKERNRSEKERMAEENRQRYGRSKADRQLEAQRKVLEDRQLDGHALTPLKLIDDGKSHNPGTSGDH